MRIIIKILLWFLGVALVAAVAAVVFLILFVDPNQYKQQISSLVEKNTGHQLRIEGDLDLTVFPWLGIRVGPLELANPTASDSLPMLTVEQIQVRAKLMPLLKRELQVDTVVVQNPVMRMVVGPDGATNWQDFLTILGERNANGETGMPLAALAVKGLHLTGGELLWEERSSGTTYTFSDIALESGELLSPDPVDLALAFQFDMENLSQPVSASMKTTLLLKNENTLIRLGESFVQADYGNLGSFKANFQSAAYDQIGSKLEVAELDVDGAYAPLDFLHPVLFAAHGAIELDTSNAILLKLGDLRGEIAYGSEASSDFSLVSLHYDGRTPTVDIQSLGLQIQYEDHTADATVAKATADLDEHLISIPQAEFTVNGVIDAILSLHVEDYLDAIRYGGQIKTGIFKPVEVLERIDMPWQPNDPAALSTARISTRFEGGADSVRFDQLDVSLDDTHFGGYLVIDEFTHPQFRFDLDIDQIDLDRYLAEETAADSSATLIVLPVGLLRDLWLNGEVRVGAFKVAGINTSNIEIAAETTVDGLTVNPMKANLYNGSLEGEAHFTQQQGRATLSVHQVMNQVDMGPLLRDMQITERIDGKGKLVLDVQTEEVNGDLSTDGVAGFRFFDGAIKGLDLRALYLQAKEIYYQRKGKEQTVPTDDRVEFSFTEMTGKLAFDEETASNDDLYIKSPLFRITGEGQANLAADKLDYLIRATIVESGKGQGGEELKDLKGITLPIRVTGSLLAPVYQLDMTKLLEALVKERVQQETKKLEQKLEEKIEQEIQEKLKKLLN